MQDSQSMLTGILRPEPVPDDAKVLFLCAGSGIGGMERVVMTLAQEFQERQIPVAIALPQVDDAEITRKWFQSSGVDAQAHTAIKHGFGKRRLSDVPALVAFLRQSPAKVVNIHYGMNFPSLNDVLAVRLAGKRCVVSVHSGGGMDPPASPERRRKNRLTSRLCSSLIAVSRFQESEMIRNGILDAQIRVIPCGIRVPERLPERDNARFRVGIPQDAFVVACAGRLTVRKGMADLIKALGRLRNEEVFEGRSQETLLLIAGEGPERDYLENLATASLGEGRFRFLGQIRDAAYMQDFYAASDLFALPSYEESFCLVYAEAAFHGVPSIGTRVGGIPDTILAEKTGLLTKPGDIPQLAEAIRRLRDDNNLRERLGSAARRHAYTEFTAARMANQYQQVLLPRRQEEFAGDHKSLNEPWRKQI